MKVTVVRDLKLYGLVERYQCLVERYQCLEEVTVSIFTLFKVEDGDALYSETLRTMYRTVEHYVPDHIALHI
jgi:hypothetical protein